MKKLMLMMFIIVLLVGTVSALTLTTWDNIKYYDKETKTITIRNNFILEVLERATLTSNTYNCASECKAEKEITLYKDGVLIQDLRFYRLFTDGSKELSEPRRYNLKYYADVGEKVYNTVEILKNGTKIKEYSHLDYNGKNQKWIPYQLGTEVKAGTYQVELTGTKKVNKIYDWQIQLQGRWINEWATWGNISLGDDAEVLLISPEDNITKLINDPIFYNATANITGGSTLTNISLYDDSSGTWKLNETIIIGGFEDPVDDVNGLTLDDSTGVTPKGGNQITPNFNISVINITRHPSSTATMAYIQDSGFSTLTNGASAFVGGVAVFSGVQTLVKGTIYYVVVDNNGSTYTHFFGASINPYPVEGTNLNWTNGAFNGAALPERAREPISMWTEVVLGDPTFSAQNFSKNVLRETIWNVQGCDSDGDCGFATANRTVRIQPTLNVFSPTNSTFTTSTIFFNATNDTEIDKWIVNYNGTNITLSDINTTLEVEDGIFQLLLYANSTSGIFGLNDTIFFSVDTLFPQVLATSPIGDQGTFTSGRNLSLEWTVTDATLETCFYDYSGSNTTVTCSINQTNLTVTDSSLTDLIFWANDSSGQLNSSSVSWNYSFIENNITFETNVSETSSQFFQINLSTSLSVQSINAKLTYNGTNFTSNAKCDGFCIVNNTIDIPLVLDDESETKSFFWEINIFNGTDSISVTTSTQTQNVTKVHLETCDGTFTTQSLNFTTYDEQNLTRLSPYKFDGTFNIWIGSGSVKRENNFSESSITNKALCIKPNATYFTDAQIEYNTPGNLTIYTTRNYYFQNNTINNISQDIFLYLLSSDSSTSFILKIQDDNLLPLISHIIKTERFYPGENLFRVVQIAKTSENGKTIGFFETEIVDYRFIISLNALNLLTTTQQKIIGEIAPFTLTFTIGENLGKPWKTLENITDLGFSLIFNKSTNIIIYTYTDTSGEFTLGTLIVEKQNFSFSTNIGVCNSNSSQSSATITCNVSGNSTGVYIVRAFITRGDGESLISQTGFILEDFLNILGMSGVFFAWFLILISSFALKFNEIAGIFMINATVIFVNIIGLVSFGILSISALIAVSIIIVVVIEK